MHIPIDFRDSRFQHGPRMFCLCPIHSNTSSGNTEDRPHTFLLRLTPKTPQINGDYTPIEASRCQDKTLKTEWVLARAPRDKNLRLRLRASRRPDASGKTARYFFATIYIDCTKGTLRRPAFSGRAFGRVDLKRKKARAPKSPAGSYGGNRPRLEGVALACPAKRGEPHIGRPRWGQEHKTNDEAGGRVAAD